MRFHSSPTPNTRCVPAQHRQRAFSCRRIAVGTIMAAGLAIIAAPALAQTTGQTVLARYDISFAGVKIGKFSFDSRIEGSRYTLQSGAKVKVLFGAFRWKSRSTTTGIVAAKPTPSTFDFDFKIKKKRKRSSIAFSKGRVVKLDNQPPVRYGRKHVQLRQEHLVGVVDPMTAIMQMSQLGKGDPCRKTVEVFDGRQRMRLSLSSKGRRRIRDQRPTGQPKTGYVCGVKFTPIAGHKRGRNIDFISNNNGIEIVLRPIKGTEFAVPYQIKVPTMVGSVSITVRSIDILTAGNQKIVLRN